MQELLNKIVKLVVLEFPQITRIGDPITIQVRYEGLLSMIEDNMIRIEDCVETSTNFSRKTLPVKFFNTKCPAFVSIELKG